MISKEDLQIVLVGIVIAVVWGYFKDLQNGEIGWFIGRMVFVPAFMLLAQKVAKKLKK